MDRAIQVSVAVHHVGEAVGVKETPGHPRDDPARGPGLVPARQYPRRARRRRHGLHIYDVLDRQGPEGARGRAHPERPQSGGRDRGAADGGGSRGGGCADGRRRGARAGSAHRAQAEGRRAEGRRPATRRSKWPRPSSASATQGRSIGTRVTTWASASWMGWPAASTRASPARPSHLVAQARWRGRRAPPHQARLLHERLGTRGGAALPEAPPRPRRSHHRLRRPRSSRSARCACG